MLILAKSRAIIEFVKEKLYEIIFEADTTAGKAFDIALIVSVILSVLAVMMESVEALSEAYPQLFNFLEWLFTILFSIELILRIYCARDWKNYLLSFYGLVDLVSILPSYMTFLFPGLSSFGVIRAFRILRIFRILKLNRYLIASNQLAGALKSSREKITVFLGTVIFMVFSMGAVMYLIEGKENGFTSIPKSVYWAIVTMTTVGFGDIVPKTALGQFISSILMIVGYGVIAVPTGLVTAEMVAQKSLDITKKCEPCNINAHDPEANYCYKCGKKLN